MNSCFERVFVSLFSILVLISVCQAQNNYDQTTTVSSGMYGGGCLSPRSLVQLADKSYVKIGDLKAGDYIRTFDHSSGKIVDSRFIDYLHFEKSSVYGFVSIKTVDSKLPSLEISEYHLIQRLKKGSDNNDHEFVYAKDLVKGDKLFVLGSDESTMEYVEIQSLETVYEQGAYAPLTEYGTLIANSVLTSCYANNRWHEYSHMAFAPYRVWTRLMYSNIENAAESSDHGKTHYVNSYGNILYNIVNKITFASAFEF